MWRLLKETYNGVQNKVFFGTMATQWYTISTGLKQGCCLSPTTFSIIMTDLISALNNQEMGIPFNEKKIPALLFADDIVLFAESEEQLQQMLRIVNDFGVKWGFNFDPIKSKVMVIGKRLDKDKIWLLGDLEIKEVSAYKYLGIYISRSLKDTFHVNTLMKKKADVIRNLISSTLTKHCNVKRIEFGNTLYNAKFVPGITHGCGIFVTNQTINDKIATMQYKMAQDIFQLKCKPAKQALLGDLGWKPICDLIDKRRIDYFVYLKNSLMDGLHRDVFNSLYDDFKSGNEGPWPYFSNIKTVLSKYGLDDVIHRNDVEWYYSFLQISEDMRKSELVEGIQDRSSLGTYKLLKQTTRMDRYLKSDMDFYGQKIKFKARSGCLGLGSDLKRWKKSNGICTACNLNSEDTIEHRLLFCPFDIQKRLEFHNNVLQIVGADVLNVYLQLNTITKINWLLGDGAYDTWGQEQGKLFDKCSKRFLVNIYSDIKERMYRVLS